MKRALIYASVTSMIEKFNMENIRLLINMGYKVDVACNMNEGSAMSSSEKDKFKEELSSMNVTIHHIPIPRKITSINKIIKSYKITRRILRDEKYNLIHCHSPIGGVIARLANFLSRKKETKLIYTAHGFHFHKKASFLNWILFFPIEYILSYLTHTLITINHEDYTLAKKYFRSRRVEYIPGVGIDIDRINSIEVNRVDYRRRIGVDENAFVILSVGELNNNKNHKVIIEALTEIEKEDIYYIICGKGPLRDELESIAREKKIEDRVLLLGYREDIIEIAKSSDIFAFPSKREGLGVAALEAMACGLPLVTSNVHGIVDYSIDGYTGFNCSTDDVDGFSNAIKCLSNNKELMKKLSRNGIYESRKFDIDIVNEKMEQIYKIIL